MPSGLDRERIPVGGSAAAIEESYPAPSTTAPHEASPNVSPNSVRLPLLTPSDLILPRSDLFATLLTKPINQSRTEKIKVPLGDKIAGSFEKIVGKLTKNEQKIEHGQAKKDGTLLL